MKFADLYHLQVNLFAKHIVVDLIIVIIITAISVFLLIVFAKHKSIYERKNVRHLNYLIYYEISIFSILFIVHLLFSLRPIIFFGLSTISAIKLFVLPFSYGLYLTFLMKKVDHLVERKLPVFELLQFNKTYKLFIHFSIAPLLLTTLLTFF